MLAFLLSVLGVLVVAAVLFLGGSVLLGRGETQPPAEPGRSPVELPDDRPVTGDDVRALRISVAVRGYRMTEVDWLLDQFAQTLDERDEQIARLQARLAATSARPPSGATAAGRSGALGSGADGGPAGGAAGVTLPSPGPGETAEQEGAGRDG